MHLFGLHYSSQAQKDAKILHLLISKPGLKLHSHDTELNSAQQAANKLLADVKLVLDGMPRKIADGPADPFDLELSEFEVWRRERLKVPQMQLKKGRLWLNDGSCVRLRLEYRNHIWSYDFAHCRTDDGKVFRILNIIDEFSRECLAIKVDRKLNSTNVVDALTYLFIMRGSLAFIRSDNGPELIAQAVRDWIAAVGAKTAYIESGSPWENGYCESFNGSFRDELLNGEFFYSLRKA